MFDFEKIMAAKTDSELLEVLNEEAKYQPGAIIAARNELSVRNLSVTALADAEKKYSEIKAIDESKANAPLDGHWKVLTFLFPLLLTVILSGYLKSGGYERKSKELVTWTFYGFGFYTLLILLINIR